MGSVFRTRERKPTNFTPFVDEYFLNGKGKLEKKPVQRNVQEVINSQVYTKLDEIYDVFSKAPNVKMDFVDEMVRDVVKYETDIDILLEADNLIEEYRGEYGLGADMSRSDIYGIIMSRAEHKRQELKNLNNDNIDSAVAQSQVDEFILKENSDEKAQNKVEQDNK